MYKAKVYAVGTELEFEESSLKEMWKRLAFFQSLPDVCPIDDTPTRLFYKEPEGNSYFSVVNTGQLHIEYKLGQYKEAKDDLFGKGEWWWWDWENKEDVLLCKWGQLTPEGEAMRERLKSSAPVAHKGAQKPTERTKAPQPSNRTAQHSNSPQRPPAWPTSDDLNFVLGDVPEVNPDGGNDAMWEEMAQEARDNEAADKKAKQPFAWPKSEEALELCAGTINSADLNERCHKMIQYFVGLNEGSRNAMTDKQYQFLAGLLDKRYKAMGAHNAILSALIGGVVDGEHIPGFDVKVLIDWLKDDKTNAQKLAILDELVSFVMADLAQFELA